jgi:Putative inner membrane protein (DUF1819)
MMLADTIAEQPAQAAYDTIKGFASSSDRTPLGRELERWSSRNSSKGALLLQSVKCLQFLAEGHSVDELQQAIREKDLLGKRTREARRTYWRLISWRYLTPPDSTVIRALAALSYHGADDPVLRGTLYFHFCLADRLTFDVATDLLWTLQQQGRDIINAAEVEAYIRAGAAMHPEVDNWSSRTLKKLASSVLSALRDFDRLAGGSKKRLVQPTLPDELLVYVSKFLSAEGKTAREILGAPDFRLWGRLENRHAMHLKTLGCHEPSDHVFVAVANNAGRYLVTEDSDFGKGHVNRSLAKARVASYLKEKLGMTVHDAKEARSHLSRGAS